MTRRPMPLVLSSRELNFVPGFALYHVRPRTDGTLAPIRGLRARGSVLRTVRRTARDDLASFAADLRELEAAAESPAAAEAYRAALAAYERAELACDRARSPEDLRAVASTLVRGRHELARARALLDGDEPPASRRPCFFDVRHVLVDGHPVPYWAAPREFRPWIEGQYG